MLQRLTQLAFSILLSLVRLRGFFRTDFLWRHGLVQGAALVGVFVLPPTFATARLDRDAPVAAAPPVTLSSAISDRQAVFEVPSLTTAELPVGDDASDAEDTPIADPEPIIALQHTVHSGDTMHADFILGLVNGAQASQRLTGVPSSVTLAQAILETAWGTSYLAREANNYFGIKAYSKPGSDGVVWIEAWEVDEGGKNVVRPEPFRRYNDAAESLVDHGKFFLENSRYASALEASDDPREFARRINAAGYATDPAYASKLISYMDSYDLYQWDLGR